MGDRHLIATLSDGVLAAVVDGLGHGQEAARSAQTAIRILEKHANESIIPLVKKCHQELQGMRGVAMSLASLSIPAGTLTWMGIGNVQGLLLRMNSDQELPREALLLRAGVVGERLPPLRATMLPILPGDVLVLATDGIDHKFQITPFRGDAPQKWADRILSECARDSDDALVLVAKYIG